MERDAALPSGPGAGPCRSLLPSCRRGAVPLSERRRALRSGPGAWPGGALPAPGGCFSPCVEVNERRPLSLRREEPAGGCK